jgi:G patch domain-containing protein 1
MIEQNSDAAAPPARRARPLGMEERARILGETPLPARVGARASDAPAPAPAPRQKLSIDGIASDDRERIQKLLSKTFTSGGVVQAANVEKVGLHVPEKSAPKPAANDEEAAARADMISRMPIVSVRNTIDWAPEPLVCKRFGIQDPFANRQRPDTQEYKFRTDVLALDATSAAARANAPKYLDVPPPPVTETPTTAVVPPMPQPPSSSAPPPPPPTTHSENTMIEVPPPPPFVEKPMGLFKAIFENSDDDVEDEDQANETEADLEDIKAALLTKPNPVPVEEDIQPIERPVWSSAVMASARTPASERDSEKRKRSKKKKEKKEKKHSKDSRRRRKKHRKRSRRDYDSSSSSSSYTSD